MISHHPLGLGIEEALELSNKDESEDATFWLLERMVRDHAGERVFEAGDAVLRGMDPLSLEPLIDAVTKMVSTDDTVKNSEAVPSLVDSSA